MNGIVGINQEPRLTKEQTTQEEQNSAWTPLVFPNHPIDPIDPLYQE
jgi:hypothetical protein